MTTSGLITASMTANQLITTAAVMIGACDPDEGLAPEQANVGLTHMQWMLKTWQADGCPLWREFEYTQAYAIGDTEHTLAPFVIDVLEARLQIDATNERPLGRWEWGEWVMLPNKMTQGTPTAFTLRKTTSAITMRLWPVPSAAYTVNYTGARVIEDITDLSQTVDIPQAWTETIYTNLAARLISPYRVSPTPEILDVVQRAAQLYAGLRDMDRPASVFFARQ